MTVSICRAACLIALCLLISPHGIAVELPSYDRVRILHSPVSIEDVELVNHEGESVRISDLHGRVGLIFFGFTNCPDVCPIAMEHLRQFRDTDNVDMSRIAFVLVSVDGERDTPEVMKNYLEKFSSDFIGLTGAPAVVKRLAGQFRAAFFKRGSSANGGYTMAHSPQVFVIDSAGRLRAEFYAPTMEAMTAITQALLDESG